MRRLAQHGRVFLAACSHNGPSASPSMSRVTLSGLRRRLASAATSAGASAEASGARASGWTPLSAVLFIPSAVCGCLAYWQYERMKWKTELIKLRENVSAAEPADLYSLAEAPKEYDKVSVRGRFLHEYSLYVGPRPRSVPGEGIQSGYLVITPMVAEGKKGVVLVNRGWVPASWRAEAQEAAAVTLREREAREAQAAAAKEAAAAAAAAPARKSSWFGWGSKKAAAPELVPAPAPPKRSELETVVGVIQADETPSQFMPNNKPEDDEFHSVHREELIRALGLPADTPLIQAITTDAATSVHVPKRPSPSSPTSTSASGEVDDDEAGPPALTYPIPKNVGDLVRFTTMPADHLNYAIIWTSLALGVALMARQVIVRPWRGPRIVDSEGGSGARDAWKATQAKVN